MLTTIAWLLYYLLEQVESLPYADGYIIAGTGETLVSEKPYL